MPAERLTVRMTVAELARAISHPGGRREEDEHFVDRAGRALSDAQAIALAKRLEAVTGDRIVTGRHDG